MFKTQRYEAVEINIPAGTTLTKFNFPDLPNLTGRDGNPVIIDSIVSYYNDTIPSSPISGSTTISFTDFQKSFLTIYQGDLQVLYNIPLVELAYVGDPSANNNSLVNYIPLLRDLINVSWTKSFVTVTGGTPPTGDTVFVFGVHYTVISNSPVLIPTTENLLLDAIKEQNKALISMGTYFANR
jgi:hypothetical protein